MKCSRVLLFSVYVGGTIIGFQSFVGKSYVEAKQFQESQQVESFAVRGNGIQVASLASQFGVTHVGIVSDPSGSLHKVDIYDANGRDVDDIYTADKVFIVSANGRRYGILWYRNQIRYIDQNYVGGIVPCTGNSSELDYCQPTRFRN